MADVQGHVLWTMGPVLPVWDPRWPAPHWSKRLWLGLLSAASLAPPDLRSMERTHSLPENGS